MRRARCEAQTLRSGEAIMSPNRAKLLVVDDTRTIRKIIRDLMHELGFVIIDEAPDGRSALELFHKSPYDLVLTDWNMPYLTGIELLRAIRHDRVPEFVTIHRTGKVRQVRSRGCRPARFIGKS